MLDVVFVRPGHPRPGGVQPLAARVRIRLHCGCADPRGQPRVEPCATPAERRPGPAIAARRHRPHTHDVGRVRRQAPKGGHRRGRRVLRPVLFEHFHIRVQPVTHPITRNGLCADRRLPRNLQLRGGAGAVSGSDPRRTHLTRPFRCVDVNASGFRAPPRRVLRQHPDFVARTRIQPRHGCGLPGLQIGFEPAGRRGGHLAVTHPVAFHRRRRRHRFPTHVQAVCFVAGRGHRG